jgi:hypothetical protein
MTVLWIFEFKLDKTIHKSLIISMGAVLMKLFYQVMQVQVGLAVTLKITVKLRLASHMGVSVITTLSTTVKVSRQAQNITSGCMIIRMSLFV